MLFVAAHRATQTNAALVAAPRDAGVDAEQLAPHELLRATRPDDAILVVKPRFGSWGCDVMLCRDEHELGRAFAAIRERRWFRRHAALVQEYVETDGRDLRVVVAAGQVVGAIERQAAPGEWRTNVALGGRREAAEPPPSAAAIAAAATTAVGAQLAGVDLLRSAAYGWVVLQVNGAVDFTREYARGDVYAAAAAALAPLLGRDVERAALPALALA